jgi:hypothetical protein
MTDKRPQSIGASVVRMSPSGIGYFPIPNDPFNKCTLVLAGRTYCCVIFWALIHEMGWYRRLGLQLRYDVSHGFLLGIRIELAFQFIDKDGH